MTLVERIRAIERKYSAALLGAAGAHGPDEAARIPTGWRTVDAAIGGGLVRGGLHEWLGNEAAVSQGMPWTPPLGLVVHLGWRMLETSPSSTWLAWIGAACFPYPATLVRRTADDRQLMERSIFVAADPAADRLWAIDLALRSPAVAGVIADSRQFKLPASRRIQFLAQAHGKPVICVRPPAERAEASAACSRWRVHWESSQNAAPRWRVELLRCKGVQPASCPAWVLEWNRATGVVGLPSALADPMRQSRIGARTRSA